jgi:hypothetical protein
VKSMLTKQLSNDYLGANSLFVDKRTAPNQRKAHFEQIILRGVNC